MGIASLRLHVEQEARGRKAIGCHKHSQTQVSIAKTQEGTCIVQVGTAKEKRENRMRAQSIGSVMQGLSKKGSQREKGRGET